MMIPDELERHIDALVHRLNKVQSPKNKAYFQGRLDAFKEVIEGA